MNLSFHVTGEFESIIDPPGEKATGHCKGRGDSSEEKEGEASDLKRRVLKEEIEKNEERRGHQKSDGKVNQGGVGMSFCHRESIEEILKEGWKMFQFL